MPTNLTIDGAAEAFVRDQLASGLYSSASDIVSEALHLMAQGVRLSAMRIDEVDALIATGLSSLDNGYDEDGELVFDRLEAGLRAREGRTPG